MQYSWKQFILVNDVGKQILPDDMQKLSDQVSFMFCRVVWRAWENHLFTA